MDSSHQKKNQSIRCIVFSFDRAMQLDAVLNSFNVHCLDRDKVYFFVLYRASSQRHEDQYKILKELHPDVTFVKEGNFRHNVLDLISPGNDFLQRITRYWLVDIINMMVSILCKLPGRIIRETSKQIHKILLRKLLPSKICEPYILFLVDDNLFVRDFILADLFEALQCQPTSIGFSLRLGENIKYSYTKDIPLKLPKFTFLLNGLLIFDWTISDGEFSYPLELSSSIYRSSDIVPLVWGLRFSNPNELEFQMAIRSSEFRVKQPNLLCAQKSLTFCNPVNIVQNFAPNRSGNLKKNSIEQLATLFDQGYRVQVESYRGFVPISCHREVDLEFQRR